MIIYIQGEAERYLGNLTTADREALIELGEAGYRSRHLVLSSRSVLKVLHGRKDLSPRATAYFGRILSEYPQLGGVLNRGLKYVIVSPVTLVPICNGGVWELPLSKFDCNELSGCSELVCENDNDFDVYTVLARISAAIDFPGYLVALKSRPGGGGACVGVLRRFLVPPNPFGLCVLDSDKTHLGAAEGTTAKACRKVWTDNWRVGLIVLSSRELENILPISLIRSFARAAGQELDVLERFSLLPKDLSSFVCLKTGERICRFHEIAPSSHGYQDIKMALLEGSRRLPELRHCGALCAEKRCTVVPALGEDFLERFGSWLQNNYHSAEIKYENWSDELMSVIRHIISSGLALPTKR